MAENSQDDKLDTINETVEKAKASISNPKAPAEVAKSPDKYEVTNKTGRPSEFTQDMANEVCARLSTGMSMRSVAKDPDMPAQSTLFKWLNDYPSFSEQYTRAKQEAADAMAEDILDISDDGTNDWMAVNYGDNEVWKTNGEALQRSRLRVETRKWLMAKMKPRKYGDKIDVTTDGKQLPAPLLGGISIDKGETNGTNDTTKAE